MRGRLLSLILQMRMICFLVSSDFEYDCGDCFADLLDDGDVLDEFLSQEEAMEMALRETQMQAQTQAHGRVDQLRGNGSGNDVPYSDDDYDDIFMRLQEQSQDMDMS